MSVTIFTVGHSTHPVEELIGLLRDAGVRRLVDVRSAPGSRKHPQFGREPLAASLDAAGIAYDWWEEFGGWRKTRPESRHVAIRSPGFRGYADHMETREFREARRRLIETSRETPTAVMCAEGLWFRCHRSMLADALVAAGCRVVHIMPDGRRQEHRLRDAARVEEGIPVYDRDERP